MNPRGIVAVILATSVGLFLVGGIIGHAMGAPPFIPESLAAAKEILLAVVGGLIAWLALGSGPPED